MSYARRLVHSLAIVTPTDGALDNYGHPAEGAPTETLVSGLVQPLSAFEVARVSQAGTPFSDHRIFLALADRPAQSAYIRWEPDDGRRYEIAGIEAHEYGRSPHLEILARLIGVPIPVGS